MKNCSMNEIINITDPNRDKVPLHNANLFFYGDEENPFLAPRGVHTVNGKLLVADTSQNRIFIWNKLPSTQYQKPDVILGQINAEETQRNAGGEISASTLLYPSGLWSNGKKLVVADAWNHRVLIWNNFPTQNGQPADIVIGQKNMNSNLPNETGVGAAATAQNLYWPYGVWSDGDHLWIADTGNRRVLFYENFPIQNYPSADKVIGKSSFTEKDYDTGHAVWPYSIKVSGTGILAITDTQYYRVLVWNNWEDAFAKPADVILGQADLESNGQNQFRLRPAANTLNWCYDTFITEEDIWVADTGNSRILSFKIAALENNQQAEKQFGNIDFEAIGEHMEVGKMNSERLYWPFSITATIDQLIVADTGNNRIAIYNL